MPRQPKFDEKTIRKLVPGDKPRLIQDATLPGFALRVQPSGRKSWVLRYKCPDGRRTTKTLGLFPVSTYGMALHKAKALLRGEDIDAAPVAEDLVDVRRIPTLGEFVEDRYAEHLQAHNRRPDYALARLRHFGIDGVPLDKITKDAISRWRAGLLKKGRAPSTLNRSVTDLQAMLNLAVEWGVIEVNPLAGLKRLKIDRNPTPRYLSPDEEKRLLAALAIRDERKRRERESANAWRRKRGYELLAEIHTYCDKLTPMVLLALNTGLRRGELASLQWGDVDLKGERLTVHGRYAKSGQTRHVPLNAKAIEVLKLWKGRGRPKSAEAVFGNRQFQTAWGRVLRDAGIEGFRFHDTRHTFASKLVMRGAPLYTVAKLLGHSDTKVTEVYAHLAPENLRQAVDLL